MTHEVRRRNVRLLGYAIGVALLLAAFFAVVRDREHLARTLEAMRSSSPWLVAAAFVLPVLNWVLTAEMFRLLMSPRTLDAYVAPTRVEMLLLIGSAWLANYIPMRPGLFGRLAYHTKVNRAPLARGMQSIFLSIACGGLAVALALVGAWVSSFSPEFVGNGIVLAAAPASVLFAASRCVHRGGLRQFLTASAVRALDVAVWMLRYAVVFRIAGGPSLSVRQAAAVGAVSQAAMLVPFVGNGLGVREFAVGIAGSSLPDWYVGSSAAEIGQPVAIAADLLNRAAEMAMAVPIGLTCGWLLMRRIARVNPSADVSNLNAGDRT